MQAYIYDKRSQTWERIQDLPKSHMTQLCGVVSEAGIPKYVLLSQGMYYDLESGTWTTDEGEREIHTTKSITAPSSNIFLAEYKNPNVHGGMLGWGHTNFGLTVPFGDTFLDVSDPNGEVYKFNPNGQAGSKWILMPEKGRQVYYAYGWVRQDGYKLYK